MFWRSKHETKIANLEATCEYLGGVLGVAVNALRMTADQLDVLSQPKSGAHLRELADELHGHRKNAEDKRRAF